MVRYKRKGDDASITDKKKKKNDDALHSLNSSDSSDFKDSDMNDVFNLNNNLIKSGTICG